MGITETWLHQEGDDSIIGDLCPTGYKFIHVPRSNGTGGGVGLLYRQSVRARLRTCEHSFRSFEYLDASFINVTNVRVIVIYRPPAVGLSPEIFLDDFSTLLEELIICSEELLIMGDFNLHIDDIENTQAVRFISLLDSFGLKQHVVSPTHRGGHILDLVITRDHCVALEVSNICVLEQPVSDHKPIWFNLNLEKQSNQRKTVVSRRLKNFDCESFNIRITSSGLLNMDDDTSLSALVNNYDTFLCCILLCSSKCIMV